MSDEDVRLVVITVPHRPRERCYGAVRAKDLQFAINDARKHSGLLVELSWDTLPGVRENVSAQDVARPIGAFAPGLRRVMALGMADVGAEEWGAWLLECEPPPVPA